MSQGARIRKYSQHRSSSPALLNLFRPEVGVTALRVTEIAEVGWSRRALGIVGMVKVHHSAYLGSVLYRASSFANPTARTSALKKIAKKTGIQDRCKFIIGKLRVDLQGQSDKAEMVHPWETLKARPRQYGTMTNLNYGSSSLPLLPPCHRSYIV